MAAQESFSMLGAGLGAQIAEAFTRHRDDPVDFGQQRLPEGIENGVAQLTHMGFDKIKTGANAGKWYFRGSGVVKSPAAVDVNGTMVSVDGLQTSSFVNFFATAKRTIEDQYADYLNLFKQFGVDMPPGRGQAGNPGESAEQFTARLDAYFKSASEALVSQGVYFKFRTWKGKATKEYPNPRVNEEWQGITSWTPTQAGAAQTNGVYSPQAPPQTPPPSTTMGPRPFEDTPNPPSSNPQSAPSAPAGMAAPPLATDVLSALAEMADSDPEGVTDDGINSAKQLTDAAIAAGVPDEARRKAANWSEVVQLILLKGLQKGAPVVGSAAPSPNGSALPYPAKGDKRTFQGQQCEVTSFDPAAKTATLKGPDGKAVVGGDKRLLKVPVAELS